MADRVKLCQGQDFGLSGGGIGLTDTSITIDDFVLPNSGQEITMAMFGAIGYITLEPETDREENISFTDVIQNGDTTATITGVVRGLPLATTADPADYNTPDLALRQAHSGGSLCRITNSVSLLQWFASKANEETIEEKWTFPSIAGDNRPVIGSDTDAILATELITKGQADRMITASVLSPFIVSTSTGTTGTSTASSLTWAHTHLGTNGLLVVEVVTQEDQTISGITFNGDALTLSVSETRVSGNLRTEIWYRVAPDLGTFNIVVTMSSAAYISGAGISFNGVNQGSPIDATSAGANGSSTAPSTGLTTITENDIIIDVLGTANDPLVATATAPQAIQAQVLAAATRQIVVSVKGTTIAGAYTNAYTISPSTNWVIQSIAIKGIANTAVDTYTVKATTVDTTPDFLDDKIEIVSADASVTVTKTIQSPGGNEKISYDLSAMGGSGGGGGIKIAIDTTEVTVANTTTETSLYVVSIPGNTLGTNDAIYFRIAVSDFDQEAGVSDELILRFKYGASTLMTLTVTDAANAITSLSGYIEGYIIADGATNAQKCSAVWWASSDNSEESTVQIIKSQGSVTGTGAVNSTVDQNLEITADWGSTGAGNSITAESIIVTQIKEAGVASEKKVGVGEITDIEWFNTQPQFLGPAGATSPYSIYDFNNIASAFHSTSYTILAAQEYIQNNGSDYNYFLPDFGTTDEGLSFDTTKQVIFQCEIRTSATSANQNLGGLGFNVFGGNDVCNSQGLGNDPVIGFVRKDSDGQWYTHVSDGGGFSETAITLTSSTNYVLRVEYDPGNATPQARFYVDGTLVDTITTNLPTAVTNPLGFAAGNGTGAGNIAISSISCPSFSVEQ